MYQNHQCLLKNDRNRGGGGLVRTPLVILVSILTLVMALLWLTIPLPWGELKLLTSTGFFSTINGHFLI